MSSRPLPNLRDVKLRALAHPCPESGGRNRTRQPRARLERWKILRDLLVESWSNPETDRSDLLHRHLDALSPLEADLIRKMFLNVERILPLPAGAQLDVAGRSFPYDHEEAGVTTSVYATFSLELPDGTTEHIRLKTGRSATTAAEAAVLAAAAEEGETFVDLMAWPGEVEPIEAPTSAEEELRSLIDGSPALARSGVRPGPYCLWCERTATCGAFPGPRVVPSTAHTFNLTKTDVLTLSQCQRRVAWRRVHGIPRDDGDEVEVASGLSQGRLFHDLVAVAESNEDPEAAAADFLQGAVASEVADLRLLWDNHRRLLAEEELAVRATEFPVGVTLLRGEREETRGATLIGFVDLTARDSSGRPVAVELKTGGAGDWTVEDDLYAVGMRRWLGEEEPLVIHRHLVRATPPECQVVTFGAHEADAALDRLQERVEAVDAWDWDDPLQPPFQVGPWCGSCEYRSTCESYR